MSCAAALHGADAAVALGALQQDCHRLHCNMYFPAACRQPLLQQQRQQQQPAQQQPASYQQQQLVLAQPQDNYLASRNEALQQVESTIRELGGIFQQLAHMVRCSRPLTRAAIV